MRQVSDLNNSKKFKQMKKDAMALEHNPMRAAAISVARNEEDLQNMLNISDHQLQVGSMKLLAALFPELKSKSRRSIN